MICWKFCIAAASLALLASCSVGREPTFHVSLSSIGSREFSERFAKIVEQRGLTANIGSATDHKGFSLYVVEAKGHGVKVWGQNMPLSEAEALACGLPAEIHSDPAQFVLTFSPTFPLFEKSAAIKLHGELRQDLLNAGYKIDLQPFPCGASHDNAAR